MTPENKAKYDAKEKRVRDAIALKEPDQIPIKPSPAIFPVLDAGYTVAQSIYDETLEIYKEAIFKYHHTFEPDAGSFYDSWMHFHENAVSEPYYPNNTPLITIDPKYQGIYDYWVQRRKETPKPLTLVEKIDQIKQDHLSSSAITYTAFTMILIGVLLLFLARKFIDKGAQNRSLMTERAEGVIKTINRNKRNNNQCGIVSFKYRGQIYEKEYVLPILKRIVLKS